MMPKSLVVLSTANLWALHKTVAELLVVRIAKRCRELDAQLARLPRRRHHAIGADRKPRWTGLRRALVPK